MFAPGGRQRGGFFGADQFGRFRDADPNAGFPLLDPLLLPKRHAGCTTSVSAGGVHSEQSKMFGLSLADRLHGRCGLERSAGSDVAGHGLV